MAKKEYAIRKLKVISIPHLRTQFEFALVPMLLIFKCQLFCIGVRGVEILRRNATIMILSVIVSKLLGILYIVPLTQLIGATGLGFYQNAYSLYAILLTLSTSGFPTAMGKMISEKIATNKPEDIEKIYRSTMKFIVRFSILSAIGIWFLAPWYAHLVVLQADRKEISDLLPAIRALSLSLLVVPAMSAYRGYLQGFNNLEQNGYSQAIEQFVRVATMVAGADLVYHAFPHRPTLVATYGAMAATLGGFFGALAGTYVLRKKTQQMRREHRQQVAVNGRYDLRSRQRVNDRMMKELWRIAIPVCIGALVVPISSFLDSITIQNLLMRAGDSFQEATEEYGILSREAFTLVQIPMSIAMAIGVSVFPSIASMRAKKDQAGMDIHIQNAIRILSLLTIPFSILLLFLSNAIDHTLFGSSEGDVVISSVCFMGFFSSLELVSTYILQGMGDMYKPIYNMFFGIMIKLILNFILIVPFGILGAAIASSVGYLFSSALNFHSMKKKSQSSVSLLKMIRPMMYAAVPMSLFLFGCDLLLKNIQSRLSFTIECFVLSIAAGLIYLWFAVYFKAITRKDIQNTPVLKRILL